MLNHPSMRAKSSAIGSDARESADCRQIRSAPSLPVCSVSGWRRALEIVCSQISKGGGETAEG